MPIALSHAGFRDGRQAGASACEVSFAAGEADFAGRFRAALRRRLAPNTVLSLKQLAHAIGVTPRALQLVMAGDIGLRGEAVARVVRFFAAAGDVAFLYEVYALPPLVWLAEHRAALERVRLTAAALLEAATEEAERVA